MTAFLSRMLASLKLAYVWVARVLCAPAHFHVPLLVRLRWAVEGGFMADQVVLYCLDARRCHEYLSEFDWYRSRGINRPFEQALNNKVLASALLGSVVPVPRTFMFEQGGCIVDAASGLYLSKTAALKVLRGAGKVVVKPMCAGKGRGVHVIEAGPGGFSLDGEPGSEAAVAALLGCSGWMACAYVEQCDALAHVFPGAANTVRIVTLREPESGEVRAEYAVLRLGTHASAPVDNGSRGGLVARVDLETGVVGAAKSIQRAGEWAEHPDTGARIEGIRLPHWHKALEGVAGAARGFPFFQMVAWDVLITREGFCVIEANTSTGVNILQLWGGERRGALGRFFRAHGVIS